MYLIFLTLYLQHFFIKISFTTFFLNQFIIIGNLMLSNLSCMQRWHKLIFRIWWGPEGIITHSFCLLSMCDYDIRWLSNSYRTQSSCNMKWKQLNSIRNFFYKVFFSTCIHYYYISNSLKHFCTHKTHHVMQCSSTYTHRIIRFVFVCISYIKW